MTPFGDSCSKVREFDYLLRRLDGDETHATKVVRDARAALVTALVPLIRGLHWKDFELLVELVMTQGGWRRVSATGGAHQHTTDIELELPLTGERALVLVKARLDQFLQSFVVFETKKGKTTKKIARDLTQICE